MTQNHYQHVVPRSHRPASQRGSISSTTVTAVLGMLVIAAVAVLSFFYLGQVQDTASQGSDIQRLEARLIELRERQRALELQSAELRSIQAIERRVPELNLMPADHVSYLAPRRDAVVAQAP